MRILNTAIALGLVTVVSAGSAHAEGLPQLNIHTYPSQLIWLALTFIILYVLMSKLALPKISTVLEERQNKIDDNLAKAEELKNQADAASAAYDKSLADARAKAHEAIRTVKDEALTEAAARQSELDASLKAKIAESEQAISKARDEAMSGITEVATDVAAAAVEKLIGEKPGSDKIGSAVDAALKNRA